MWEGEAWNKKICRKLNKFVPSRMKQRDSKEYHRVRNGRILQSELSFLLLVCGTTNINWLLKTSSLNFHVFWTSLV